MKVLRRVSACFPLTALDAAPHNSTSVYKTSPSTSVPPVDRNAQQGWREGFTKRFVNRGPPLSGHDTIRAGSAAGIKQDRCDVSPQTTTSECCMILFWFALMVWCSGVLAVLFGVLSAPSRRQRRAGSASCARIRAGLDGIWLWLFGVPVRVPARHLPRHRQQRWTAPDRHVAFPSRPDLLPPPRVFTRSGP
jgi:hypothetical protein